ncbi:hydrogenase expression/formation protein [Segnochrobactrum spirostomi]|uniref:Hydrogenase expression/formation protein n=1 Tax=Segnochrobactrum spirostomi TaxID=2608987 RepID=A0A6A7YD72_9HYPH|nr:hydrogenase expression/formation protein [Segnochrobactrum spirostomi]MQT15359.1 hydrogenase expression/formation protein [Segnochrobactrum spirostomi]
MSSLPYATVPPIGFGPGSQPEGEDGLAYLPMPSGMRTYEPHLPEIDDPSRARPAIETLEAVHAALLQWQPGTSALIPLDGLEAEARALVAETLGEGEVSVRIEAGSERIEIQEATLAGVWRIRGGDGGRSRERIEIAAFPRGALVRAFPSDQAAVIDVAAFARPGIINAPAVLAEIAHRSRTRQPGDAPHVVNLTLLPLSPEDMAAIDAVLGQGRTIILSRGYGNCRIDATGMREVWRVRYFNSTDALILDTIEIIDVPAVACAAAEDIADSAERLADILESVR